jgi:predicted transposase
MKLATKVKLVVNQKEKEQLTQTMIAFNRATNYVSKVAFENKTFGPL